MPNTDRLRIGLDLALAAIVSGLYLWTLSPGQGWLDQSEFVAGAHTLGIVHPPGHPVYIMLAKAFALLIPLGGIGFRINLLSAALGVTATLLVSAITRHIARTLDASRALAALSGFGAGLLLAVTEACWLQSVRAEVYTLNAALVLAATWLALRWWETPRRATVYAAIVLIGLGLGNHHYLVLFFLPAPLTLLCLRPDGLALLKPRALAQMLLLGLLALLAYAYLPIRAATSPAINWGDPTTLGRFLDTIMARTFQSAVATEARGASLWDNIATALVMFASKLHPIGLLAGLAGLIGLLWRARPLGILLLLAFMTNVLTKAIMRIDPSNPDDYGYLLLGVALLAVGAGLVPSLVQRRVGAKVALGLAVSVPLCAAALGARGFSAVDRSQERSAEAFVDASLDRVAPDATILLNFYGGFFNHWYAELVDERRPDVTRVHATFDAKRYEGRPYTQQLMRAHPFLKPVGAAFLASGRFPEAALRALARQRPVYIEPLVDIPPSPEGLEGFGLLRRMEGPDSDDLADAAADAAYWDRLLARVYRHGRPSPSARHVLAWFHFKAAILALRQGHPRTALGILSRAKELSKSPKFGKLRSLAHALKQADDAAETRPGSDQPFLALIRDVRRAAFRNLNYLAL